MLLKDEVDNVVYDKETVNLATTSAVYENASFMVAERDHMCVRRILRAMTQRWTPKDKTAIAERIPTTLGITSDIRIRQDLELEANRHG